MWLVGECVDVEKEVSGWATTGGWPRRARRKTIVDDDSKVAMHELAHLYFVCSLL